MESTSSSPQNDGAAAEGLQLRACVGQGPGTLHIPFGAQKNVGHPGFSISGMISQFQRHRMRVQIHLLLQVRLVELAHVVVQQGHRYD